MQWQIVLIISFLQTANPLKMNDLEHLIKIKWCTIWVCSCLNNQAPLLLHVMKTSWTEAQWKETEWEAMAEAKIYPLLPVIYWLIWFRYWKNQHWRSNLHREKTYFIWHAFIFLICVRLATVTGSSVCPAVSQTVLISALHFSQDKSWTKEEYKSYNMLKKFVTFPVLNWSKMEERRVCQKNHIQKGSKFHEHFKNY